MKVKKEIRKYKIFQFIGGILSGFGLVLLLFAVVDMMKTGIGNLTNMTLGVVLGFIGNTFRLIGKKSLDKILNS